MNLWPKSTTRTFEGWADGEGYGTYEGTDAPQELVETVGKAIVKNKGAKNGKSVNAPSLRTK